MLEFKNLSVSYLEQLALSKISFSLNRGESVGIVGESGSGKSTLALSLLNLISYPGKITGEILFNGQDILKFKENAEKYLKDHLELGIF